MKIRASERLIGERDISSLEKRLCISLPVAYRDFLKEHNGGLCESEDAVFGDTIFYSIADVPMSLASAIFERESDGLIPIAETLNQDTILILLEDGSVWHLGIRVASDFAGFLEHLAANDE